MRKLFTAIAKESFEIEPHSWDKGEKYLLTDYEYGGNLRLSSNEGAAHVTRGQRVALEANFNITEGWNE